MRLPGSGGCFKLILHPVGSCCCFIHSPSHFQLFATPRTAAHQPSLSYTISRSLLKPMSIKSLMPSNHLILCCPLLLWLSIFPSMQFFPMSWLFESGGQSIGASNSASVLPMNIQGSFPLGLTGFISLKSKGLSRSSSALQFESINSSAYNTYYSVNATCLPACMGVKSLQLCRTLCSPWTIALPAPLSLRFSRQEYWSGLAFPSLEDLSNPGDRKSVV